MALNQVQRSRVDSFVLDLTGLEPKSITFFSHRFLLPVRPQREQFHFNLEPKTVSQGFRHFPIYNLGATFASRLSAARATDNMMREY